MGAPRLFSIRLFSETFASTADSRLNNFDFLRFLFATLVLSYHCFGLLPNGRARDGAGRQSGWRHWRAGGSVDFFFVISGFLVTMSRQRSAGVWSFLKKRALRIYPGFFLASAACAFIAGPLGADSAASYWHHFRFLKFALYLFLLPADVVGPDMAHVFTRLPFRGVIDGSFWTLRYEFEMYLLTAALGSLGLLRRGRTVWVAASFLLLYALFAVSQAAHLILVPDAEIPWVGNPAAWLRLSVCFLSGMTFYLYRDRIPASPALSGLSSAGSLLRLAGQRSSNGSAPLQGCRSSAPSSPVFCSRVPAVCRRERIRLQRLPPGGARRHFLRDVPKAYAFPIQQLLIAGD